MCFSAQASFAASATLLFISALCFKKSQNNAQRFLAGCPLFFGIQQALEGIVWITLNRGDVHSMLHMISVYGFLFFAYIFWPAYIPTIIYAMEHNPLRKKIACGLLIIGSFVAATGALSLVLCSHAAQALDNHIAYACTPGIIIVAEPTLMALEYTLLALYAIAVIGALLASSMPYMWLMGILVGLGFIVAQIQYALAFGSVWCFFAALASVTLYGTIDRMKQK